MKNSTRRNMMKALVSPRVRNAMFGSQKWLAVLIALIGVCTISANTLKAAPVTFAFEAEVTEINDPDGVIATLPFQPSIGQSISGRVTFSPTSFGQTSDPDGSLEIELEGVTFAANELPLVTYNDNYFLAGFNLHGPDDGIGMSCDQLGGCPVTETSDASISLEHLGIGLTSHDLDVVPAGADVTTTEVWNSLPNRLLVFELSTSLQLAPITITAEVGPMSQVPEPSTLVLIGVIMALSILVFTARLGSE